MPPRVVALPAGRDLLRRLRDRHGALMLHQSGGCCDGSAPMCYRAGQFRVGRRDVLLGLLDLGAEVGDAPGALPEGDDAVPVWISGSQFAVWQHTQLVLDAVPGRGSGFSLDAPEGERLLTRSRVFEPTELEALSAHPALTGDQVEAGEEPSLPSDPLVVADLAEACPLPLRRG
ncbi:hypothetical protein SAMN05445756_2133 [Kytococcus aerolatus]|uniref:DUF779 domain-containing protein n=1 Tax=Kytococcus aerolatus TaxID=592308 RepID=A0A212U675_9MICO|nr:hypothetical protein SAMN05445756_2133 [Kytococcus aerolatus]